MQSQVLLLLAILAIALTATTRTEFTAHRCTLDKQDTVFAQLASRECYLTWKRRPSFVDEVTGYYDTVCQTECVQSLKSFGERCRVDIEDDLLSLGYNCAKNDDGVSCYSLAINSNEVMYNVYRNCWDMNTTCTQECHRAIATFRDTHGCCVNTLYNSTVFDVDDVLSKTIFYTKMMGVANYSLWTSCGVETLGYCDRPGELSGSDSAAPTVMFLGICLTVTGIFCLALHL